MIDAMGEHRSEFTPAEANEIQDLLREIRRAHRSRQKRLRDRLRRIGFYITDYAHDQVGLTAAFAVRIDSHHGPRTGARLHP
jgi:hypothetical protein